MAKADEAIAAVKRKLTEQTEGSDRRTIIACLQRDLAKLQTFRDDLAGIIVDIDTAWGEIASAEQSAMLLQCVSDLDKLLTNASPE